MSKIANKFLAQMPTLTIKGNNTGGTANPLDLTTSQVVTMLSVANNTLSNLASPTSINQNLESQIGVSLNLATKDNNSGATDASNLYSGGTTGAFNTGYVSIFTGDSGGGGTTGNVEISVGTSTGGPSGDIRLFTNGGTSGGNISLDTSLTGGNITVSQDPTIALGIASKQYVDARASGAFPNEIAYLKDSKTSGTAGGTFTSGAWQTRDLNTVENSQSWLSLTSNQFTLDPGTYKIVASAPAHGAVDGHKLKLRNITDSTDDIIGEAEQNSTTAMTNRSGLAGIITITATKTFEIQHYCNTTKAGDGFGSATSISAINEIYTVVEIEKLLQGGVNSPIVYFKDIKSSGTDGGTFTSGAWRTRDLNTTENSQYWASLSSNQITLNAGTYMIEASAPAYNTNVHQTRFYNITDSTEDIIGTSEYSDVIRPSTTRSFLNGIITITSSKTFELQHRCNTTQTTTGFGTAASFSSELYSTVKIQKMS